MTNRVYAILSFSMLVLRTMTYGYAQTNQKVKANVTFATTSEVFFALGANEGVVANQTINLRRGSKSIGTCMVNEVSSHQSVCQIANARAGDTADFIVQIKPEPIPAFKAFVFTSADEIERRKTLISQAALLPKAPFEKKKGLEDTESVSYTANLEHNSWYQRKSRSGNYAREAIDLGAQNINLTDNISANLDTSTWIWTSRPESTRFRSGDDFQFYVHEASIQKKVDKGVAYSLGRVRADHIPGLVVFDGASLEYVFSERGSMGVYAGLLPDITTMGLQNNVWSMGAYARYNILFGNQSSLRQSIRLGPKHTPDLKTRNELQAQLSVDFFQRINIWVDALLGVGGELDRDLDALRMGLFLRPTDRLSASLTSRVLKFQSSESTSIPAAPGSKHIDGDITYQMTPLTSASIVSGQSVQRSTEKLSRTFVGLELRMREFLKSKFTLLSGYQEDMGWIKGRQLYLFPQYASQKNFRTSLRTSFAQNQRNSQTSKEFGLGANIHTPVTSWLWFRLSSQLQMGDIPLGAFTSIGLDGTI